MAVIWYVSFFSGICAERVHKTISTNVRNGSQIEKEFGQWDSNAHTHTQWQQRQVK